jgi:nicotinamidase-related amidase
LRSVRAAVDRIGRASAVEHASSGARLSEKIGDLDTPLAAVNSIHLPTSVLVLVDYQERLLPVIHRRDEVLACATRMADIAHMLGVPVLGTEQNPAGLGATAAELGSRLDTTLAKTHFDACEDGLLGAVRAAVPHSASQAALDVVVAGCESHVCLLQTALGLLRAGHRVWVLGEACGARRASDHELALHRLRSAGAVIVSHDMVAFEWLQHCGHAQFKATLPLLKAPLGHALEKATGSEFARTTAAASRQP